MKNNEKNSAISASAPETTVNPLSNFSGIIDTIESDSVPENAVIKAQGIEIYKKEYTLATPKGKRGTVTINNPDVILSIERIKAALNGQSIMGYVICRELFKLSKNEETLKKSGFKDTSDFAAYMFGLKNITANQYIRIGREFVNDDYTLNPVLPSGTSVSAMLEMLAPATDEKGALHIERIAGWYQDGTLTDGMSTTKIRKALKPAKPSKQKEPKEEEPKEEEPKEEESAKTPDVIAGQILSHMAAVSELLLALGMGDDKSIIQAVEIIEASARQAVK